VAARWHGVEAGHGFLQAREVEVAASGRGAAGRERSVRLWLPGHDGMAVARTTAPARAEGDDGEGAVAGAAAKPVADAARALAVLVGQRRRAASC